MEEKSYFHSPNFELSSGHAQSDLSGTFQLIRNRYSSDLD